MPTRPTYKKSIQNSSGSHTCPFFEFELVAQTKLGRVVYTPTPQINGISGTIYGLNI
jgi:hypothetical protein